MADELTIQVDLSQLQPLLNRMSPAALEQRGEPRRRERVFQ